MANEITTGLTLINQDFDSWDEKGDPIVLTYTFLTSLPDYYGTGSDQINITSDFNPATYEALSETQQEVVENILKPIEGEHFRNSFSDVIDDLGFVKLAQSGSGLFESGDITVGKASTQAGVTTRGIEASVNDAGDGTIFLDTDKSGVVFNKDLLDLEGASLEDGRIGYRTFMHELSHSLGLEDAYNLASFTGSNNYLLNQKYTIMADVNPGAIPPEISIGVDYQYPYTLQLLDVLALQEMYGSRNYDTRHEY